MILNLEFLIIANICINITRLVTDIVNNRILHKHQI